MFRLKEEEGPAKVFGMKAEGAKAPAVLTERRQRVNFMCCLSISLGLGVIRLTELWGCAH